MAKNFHVRVVHFKVLQTICRFRRVTQCVYFNVYNPCIKCKCPLWFPNYKPKGVNKNET